MSRVVTAQTDLFAMAQPDLFASPAPAPIAPPVDAVGELHSLLDRLRQASVLPWVDAAAAMAEEHRALWLARLAGNEGAELAAAIFDETERLFSAAEQSPPR
jgi:hypothetical protein